MLEKTEPYMFLEIHWKKNPERISMMWSMQDVPLLYTRRIYPIM
jgi:hypothetical protein